MPKAKPTPAPAIKTRAAKQIKKPDGKSKQAKAVPIKVASKPIRKGTKAIAPPTKLPSKLLKAPTFRQGPAPPKKPLSAYNYFSTEMHTQMKGMKKFKDMPFIQRSQVVSQSWAKLNDKQKTEYNKCAADDQKRYLKEVKQFEKKGGVVKASKKSSEKDQKSVKPVKAAKDDRKSSEKKVDDTVKPKQALSAFMYFSIENRAKVLQSDPKLPVTEVGKKNGEEWKKLNDQQKKKFEQLFQKDHSRYEKEMKEFKETGFFTNSDGVNSKFLDKKHRVQEFEKGTVLPKAGKTAYMCFTTEQHAIFKSQLKEGEKYSVTEKVTQMGVKWNSMTPQQKAKYDKLSKEDHDRYEKQLQDIRKNGFFMTNDGKKSSELKFKPKKSPVKKPKQPDASPTRK